MKSYLTILLVLASFIVKGQDISRQKEWIDSLVDKIDALKDPHNPGFIVKQPKSMIYQYKTLNSRILMIGRRFKEKNDSVWQQFYIHEDQLIFSTEKITTYFKSGSKTETQDWSGRYYFSTNKLIDHRTLGHGKSEEDNWDPEKEVLKNYEAARKDVKRIYRGPKPN